MLNEPKPSPQTQIPKLKYVVWDPRVWRWEFRLELGISNLNLRISNYCTHSPPTRSCL